MINILWTILFRHKMYVRARAHTHARSHILEHLLVSFQVIIYLMLCAFVLMIIQKGGNKKKQPISEVVVLKAYEQ